MGSSLYFQPECNWIYRKRKHGNASFAEKRMSVIPWQVLLSINSIENFSTDIATESQTHDLYLTLITVLFAYFYDSRTSQHDPTPESAWTICNLIPAFTALDPPHSSHYVGESGSHTFSVDELKETLLPSYRRLLAFPLYRSFALAEKCQEDLTNALKQGKRLIIRCLLEIKDILDHHDVYYIYSKIWLDDFCVWIQSNAK